MTKNSPIAQRIGRCFGVGTLSILVVTASAATTNSGWITRAWQSDDGLPNNIVTSLAQTPDGYLWVANPSHLARFDGVQFENFPSHAVAPGHDERIAGLLQSRHGDLWLAMDHGPVVCLSGRTSRVYTNNVPDSWVQGLAEDGEGSVWVAFHGGSACRIRNDQVTYFATNNSTLPVGAVCSLASDSHGRLWFAKYGQVGVFRDGQFVTLLTLRRMITYLTNARDGGVWICQGSQLIKYNEAGKRRDAGTFNPENPNTDVTAILEDHRGAVWIGTSDSGLFRYDGAGFENIPASHHQILSLLEDRDGNIWAGTGGGGLDRIQPRTVVLEGTESGLPFEMVQSISEDTHGAIWAVTENGQLSSRAGDRWTVFSNPALVYSNAVTCVAADHAGGVWIGTRRGTLHYWRDGQFATWKNTDGLICHYIKVLLPVGDGDVWVGGTGPESLQRFHAGRFENIKLPPGVSIRAVTEDAAGNIWAGSTKRVLLRVSGGTVTDESDKTSASIRSLFATPDGSVWVGGAGSGLDRIKDGQDFRITTAKGLFDDYVSEIVADDRGWLWFGSDHGVFKVRQQEIEDLAAGRIAKVRSVHYGQDAGLPSLQAVFDYAPDALRSRDGRIWLPMRTALAVADPNKLHEDAKPPLVLLKQVVMDERPIARYGGRMTVEPAVDLENPQSALRLPPGHRRLEFDFTALSFVAPENIQFRYRLEGFDDGWIDAKTQRSANYSRLPAGQYRFVVSACNSDGVWSETNAAIGFTVDPFLWQTWWFRLGGLVLFTGAMFAVVRLVSVRRVKARLLAEQAALEKSRMSGRAEIATSVLHNVGNVLNSVNVSTSVINKRVRNSKIAMLDKVVKMLEEHSGDLPGFFTNDPKGKQLVEYLSTLAAHLGDEQSEILNEIGALENNVGHIKQIVVRQQSYARTPGAAESFNPIDVAEDALHLNASSMENNRIQIVREFQDVPAATTDKHKILQILINLISNAKHALMGDNAPLEKRLTVRVEKNGNDRVKISVIDNGAGVSDENAAQIFKYGFTTRKDGHGFGLHSSFLAARELGGNLTFYSAGAGEGATFTLEFPCQLPKNCR